MITFVLRLFFILLVSILTISQSQAEIFYLKDGAVIVGQIDSYSQGIYIITTNFGQINLEKSLVKEIKNINTLPAPDIPVTKQASTITPKTPINPKQTSELLFRVHGSNTIGSSLMPELVTDYLVRLGAKNINKIQGNNAEESTISAFLPNHSEPVGIEIYAHGSSTGFKDLLSKKTDIAMASRAIKNKEVNKLRPDYGDLRTERNEHVLALDGLAIIIHPSNNISSLTKKEMRDIFTGKINNWSQVGEHKAMINVYARDDKSGTYDTFKSLVLGKIPLTYSAKRYESNAELSDDVAKDPNGIGFTGLPYIRQSKALSVTDGGVSIPPTKFTVATEDYSLSRRLYLYAPQDKLSSHAQGFIEYALSKEGQAIVDKIGFVSLSVGIGITKIASPNVSKRYTKLTSNAERLNTTFRFRSGSSNLDSRGFKDLSRLASYIKDNGYIYRKLLLLGFTDNVGDKNINLKLSENRAASVTKALRRDGISKIGVYGFGEENPIVGNETNAGKEKNRRVEAWLEK